MSKQKVAQKVLPTLGRVGQAINPVALLREIAVGYTDYLKVHQQESTKRAAIEADRQRNLAGIEAQRAFLMDYLERSFGERERIIDKQFEVIDAALESGDVQQLQLGVEGLCRVAEASPFAALGDLAKTRAALADPSTTWSL